MPSIHAVFTACFYALILAILLTFAAMGYFLFRKYVTHAKVAAKLTDVEANITDKEQKRLRALILPTKLDPVVYPSVTRRSSRCLPSSQRVIPNPFRARSVNERLAVVNTTTLKPDGGENNNTGIHVNNDQPSTAPIHISTPPHRPPRPTLLDDLLAGFPWEHDVARDLWFPLPNAEKGNWELCVVRGTRPASRYIQGDGRDGRVGLVLALKQEKQEGDEKSYFSIDEEEVDSTPLTPSNTLVDVVVDEKSKKFKKRDERRRKRRNGRPRGPVFEIPELYVNARPYEEIEAEEEARASAFAAKSVEDEEATEMTIVIETEEEEALAVVAAAAIAARGTRDTREACKLLEVPERFFC